MLFYLGLFFAQFLPLIPYVGEKIAWLSRRLLAGQVGELYYSHVKS